MKFPIFMAALMTQFIGLAHGLTPEEIRKIADDPHNRTGMTRQLAMMYPDAREYQITMEFRDGQTGQKSKSKTTAKEKVVKGRYVVSQPVREKGEPSFIMIVTFDRERELFIKWILLEGGVLMKQTGVGDLRYRSIAWTGEHDGIKSIGLENHDDDTTTWKSSSFKDGKLVYSEKGIARKLK
ncbi:MAG: hypothetical protein ACN4GG_11960 [Akkermansiaceae bacterium]